jgi:hypothetical protein
MINFHDRLAQHALNRAGTRFVLLTVSTVVSMVL